MSEFNDEIEYAGQVLAEAELDDVIHYFVYDAELHAELLLS